MQCECAPTGSGSEIICAAEAAMLIPCSCSCHMPDKEEMRSIAEYDPVADHKLRIDDNYTETAVIRPSKDDYFCYMAKLVASRSTCPRHKVGCVVVNDSGIVLATGYNGAPSGLPHCNGSCENELTCTTSIHAEQNAVAFCHDISRARTIYSTLSPCVMCTKLLMNTGVNRIVFLEDHRDQQDASMIWCSRISGVSGVRTWTQYALPGEMSRW